MDMQKVGTILVGIIFLGSTVAYAMSFAFSNPQNKSIPDPVRGNKNAKVTIVEYSDYSCSYCREAHKTMENILSNYTGDVKLVFKHFPSDSNSIGVAHAAECAHTQGRFWNYHNRLFETDLPITNQDLKDVANKVGLNMKDFNQCLQLNSIRQEVLNDRQEGIDKNIEGTPTFFINGERVVGAQPYSSFESVIEKHLG